MGRCLARFVEHDRDRCGLGLLGTCRSGLDRGRRARQAAGPATRERAGHDGGSLAGAGAALVALATPDALWHRVGISAHLEAIRRALRDSISAAARDYPVPLTSPQILVLQVLVDHTRQTGTWLS
jgi:hypothetical protein